MTANAEQDKVSLPLMPDCTDDLPASIVPRDRGAAAANQRRTPGLRFGLRSGGGDAAWNAVYRPAPGYANRNPGNGHARARLGSVEAARVATVSRMWVQEPMAMKRHDDLMTARGLPNCPSRWARLGCDDARNRLGRNARATRPSRLGLAVAADISTGELVCSRGSYGSSQQKG